MRKCDFYTKLAESFECEAEKINPSYSEWDSMGMINLVSMIQEEFALELSMDEFSEIKNVSSIVELLKQKGVELTD